MSALFVILLEISLYDCESVLKILSQSFDISKHFSVDITCVPCSRHVLRQNLRYIFLYKNLFREFSYCVAN